MLPSMSTYGISKSRDSESWWVKPLTRADALLLGCVFGGFLPVWAAVDAVSGFDPDPLGDAQTSFYG